MIERTDNSYSKHIFKDLKNNKNIVRREMKDIRIIKWNFYSSLIQYLELKTNWMDSRLYIAGENISELENTTIEDTQIDVVRK